MIGINCPYSTSIVCKHTEITEKVTNQILPLKYYVMQNT